MPRRLGYCVERIELRSMPAGTFVTHSGKPAGAYSVMRDGDEIGCVYYYGPGPNGWCASHRGSDGVPEYRNELAAMAAVVAAESKRVRPSRRSTR